MATYTYAPERGDPLSRLRFEIGDRTDDPEKATWSDEDLLLALRDTATTDFLYLYNETEDATAASVEIRSGSDFYELVLRYTPAASSQVETPISIGSPNDVQVDKLIDVIRFIENLDQGWVIGLGSKAEGSPDQLEANPTQGLSERELAIAYAHRSWNLAPTNGALDVLSASKKVQLSIYNLSAAAVRIRSLKRDNGEEVASYTEGRVSVTLRGTGGANGAGGGGGATRAGTPAGFFGRIW